MRSAQASDETFDPRPEFDPRRLAGTHRAVVLYRPIVARWALEKGGRPLADGSAVRELQAGDDWLVGEILSHRGEAVLIEPADLRARIAEHAAELERALGAVRT
jgi:predicted DNA-binding transcriptional regulator YafY